MPIDYSELSPVRRFTWGGIESMATRGLRIIRLGSLASLFAGLVPGLPQFLGGEPERGIVLVLSFASTVTLTVMGWGTVLGWAGLGLCFVFHTASVANVISARSFPRHSSFRSGGVAAALAASLFYMPCLGVYASWFATEWSSQPNLANFVPEGYLLDRLAYTGSEPTGGQWVWLEEYARRPACLGMVLATEDEEVDWSDGLLRINGDQFLPWREAQPVLAPNSLKFKVPKQHLLVATNISPKDFAGAADWMLVPNELVVGRVWAKLFPIWQRQLLL